MNDKHASRKEHLTELLRYVAVGGWNTVFGYGLFAGLNYVFTGMIPYPYMAANAVGSIIAITVAFFAYKFFVFKTKGNYLREYLRIYVVYGASSLASFMLLPVAVALVDCWFANPTLAPYVAQAIVMPLVMMGSFIGHKRFTYAG